MFVVAVGIRIVLKCMAVIVRVVDSFGLGLEGERLCVVQMRLVGKCR